MPYRSAPSVQKPSEQLADLLWGRVAWEDAPEAIRSWAARPIYEAAVEIMRLPDKGARRNALGKIPLAIRPKVEAEVMRLWAKG